MSEAIIVQTICVLVNIASVVWQFEHENYKTAVLNGFAAGFCTLGVITAL